MKTNGKLIIYVFILVSSLKFDLTKKMIKKIKFKTMGFILLGLKPWYFILF